MELVWMSRWNRRNEDRGEEVPTRKWRESPKNIRKIVNMINSFWCNPSVTYSKGYAKKRMRYQLPPTVKFKDWQLPGFARESCFFQINLKLVLNCRAYKAPAYQIPSLKLTENCAKNLWAQFSLEGIGQFKNRKLQSHKELNSLWL